MSNVEMHATSAEFGDLKLVGQMFGDYKMVNYCTGLAPKLTLSNLTVDNAAELKINATDSAIIDINGYQDFPAKLTAQSGKIIVKGGDLWLADATLTGINSSRYFITKKNELGTFGNIYFATNTGVAKTFDMGVNLATTPTNFYTPLSITSNEDTYSGVSTQTFTPPTNFFAPNVQWIIDSYAATPDMSLTFSWEVGAASSGFTTGISRAKVYRYDGSEWVQLPSSVVTTTGGISSITANSVTTFGTFAVMVPPLPTPSVIQASTNPPYCQGGSVTLTGNVGGVWSTGTTTPSITVTTSGNYSVTNTNVNGSVTSNILTITFNALPNCTISGTPTVCLGQTTQLCAPTSTNYLWSTGATTNCITVSTPATYGVTITDANTCQSICSQAITSYCPPIISDKDGNWNVGATWVGGVVPTATDDVIIDHAVTNPSTNSTTAVCKNLTINATKTLTQSSKLQINGDMTVNGTFFQDFSGNPANFTKVGNVTAAGMNLVTVGGTMTLTGGNGSGFFMAGRIVFNTGSSLNMRSLLTFSGWSGSTPQYLLDIENLTNLTYTYTSTQPSFNVIGNTIGNTKQVISPKGNIPMTCYPVWQGVVINQTNATQNNYYFGDGDATSPRQEIDHINAQSYTTTVRNFYLNNILTRFTADYANVYSTNAEYNSITANNTNLYGAYTLRNSACGNPYLTVNNATFASSPLFPTPTSLTLNATESTNINITGILTVAGTFTAQNGKVIVNTGILNLQTTNIVGISNSNYFVTRSGGAVRLATTDRANATKFDIGINIPTTTTYFYTPLNILANTGTHSTVGAQTFTPPSLYSAPNVQWAVQSNATSATITFVWQTGLEPIGFAAGRDNAKLYRYTGTAWVLVPSTVATSTADGLVITATGVSAFGTFAVMIPPAPKTITTVASGYWSSPTTWRNGDIPTSIDDAIIDHTVDNLTNTANCNNLIINALGRLDQRSTLIVGGNLTINGIFNHAYDPFSSPSNNSTQIGASTASDAAGTRLVTVAGTLSLGNNLVGGGFFLAGRMVFNTGSTLDLKSNMNLTLTGWSGGTPQYLMDIDGLSTFNASIISVTNLVGINVPHGNGTQPIISSGRNFVSTTCNFSTTPLSFRLAGNNDYYFGGTTRRSILPINLSANANLYLNNTTMARLTANNGMSVHSTGGQFSNIDAGGGTTMYGDFTIVDDCNPAFPVAFNNTGALSFDNNMVLNVNVTNSVDFNIPTGVTQKLFGTLNAQSGKMIVKGGTLDLRGNTTMVNGLSNTRYFETQRGTGIYNTLGSVLLPSTGAAPVNFNLGITIPSLTGGSSTSMSAPVNIVSNNGACNIFVNLQPLTLPTGFTAPLIQWDISPVSLTGALPSLTMIFTWPLTAETYHFAVSRHNAKVYHWNGFLWEPLVSEPAVVNLAAGTVSMRVQNVVSFSPFMVAVENAALSVDLVRFTAKNNQNRAELTWQTASEIGIKNFDLEKSLDGKTFEKFAEVKANNTPSVYQAFDDQFSASAYYRLKINELDGRSNFSKIIYLEKNTEKTIKIRRDTEGSLSVETDDKIELITVTNTIGQVLKTTKDKQLSINNLGSGIYLISVKTDKGFLSQKFFK